MPTLKETNKIQYFIIDSDSVRILESLKDKLNIADSMRDDIMYVLNHLDKISDIKSVEFSADI